MCYNIIGDIMLKKYLQEKKISVYKLSEMSGVPYTTLNELINGKKSIKDCKIKTVESIASSLNLSIERTLSMLNNKQVVLSDSWEKNKEKIFYFPIVENNDNYDCGRIHPLMQKKVNEIYKFVKKEKAVEKVIIFGSAVNIRCNKKSDIDLAVKLKDDCFNLENQNQISEEIQSITDYNADIVWLNKIDPETQLYRNISLKGVVVYE